MAAFAVSACAAAPADEPAGGPSEASVATTVALSGGGVVVGRQDSGAAHRLTKQPLSESSGAGHLGRAESLEGAGAAPRGLQRRLGRWDLPGPLLRFGSVVLGRDYVVLDRCERPELLSGWQAAGGWGAPVPDFGMTAWTRRLVERDLARCATHRFEIVGDAGDPDPRYFSERGAAERWLERQHTNLARRYSVAGSETLRDGSFVAGFVDSASPVQGGPLGIMFAPVDAPVDEVRVLPWSVHASDGALRGLVRNWSRHLWAYDVTIAADDRTFVWPLSVQPGETAPFEIGGWQGPSDREQVDVRVTADMSPYVDPSRAYAYESAYGSYGNYPQHRIEVSGDGWDRYSDVWTQEETGAVSVGLFTWQPRRIVPDSHPSLVDDIENMHAGDLRAYGAVLDGTGRVLQVSPALVGHLEVAYADSGAVSGGQWIYEQRSDSGWTAPRAVALPVFEELPRQHPQGAIMGVDFHSYDPSTGEYLRWDSRSGGFIIWIGAAHPERELG